MGRIRGLSRQEALLLCLLRFSKSVIFDPKIQRLEDCLKFRISMDKMQDTKQVVLISGFERAQCLPYP
jgi:hypothetical protein